MSENQPKASDISQVAKKELEVLDYWKEKDIFQKTLEKHSPKGEFIFYDGPPFATGKPHYGHLLPGTIKDVIPRYKTMQGYHVDRQWGWDCHGLPIESLIQKEHDLQTAKDVENFGIENFNVKAKESVFRYDEEWKKIIPRTGRWVDMENPYTTMHPLYTQSGHQVFNLDRTGSRKGNENIRKGHVDLRFFLAWRNQYGEQTH